MRRLDVSKSPLNSGITLQQVQTWLSTQDEKKLAKGDPVHWAIAAHDVAVSSTYAIPHDGELGDNYIKANVPIVVQQLGTAGVRLAAILNDLKP